MASSGSLSETWRAWTGGCRAPIRKAVGDGGLIESGGHIDLDESGVRVDVRLLDRALAEEDLERVHALWKGVPFAGFSLGGAAVFNDWADRIRNRYERRVAELLAVKARTARTSCSEGRWLETEMKHGPVRAYHGRRYRLEGDEG